jgi:multimeric flavodoxin WrbA
MKVIALNSSPNRDKGGTGRILSPFLRGMADAGAEVTLYHLDQQKIKPCRGCLGCWFRTPGRCRQRDDMDEILPEVAASDALVLATPLYVDGMSGVMKTFLDRCIPLLEPFFVVVDNHCRHDRRPEYREGKVVLVSVAGFTELDNFDPLVAHVRAACLNLRREYAGALLRPIANSIDEIREAGVSIADVIAACWQAGVELVRDGAMKPETLARVSRELLPRGSYIKAINLHFRQVLEKHGLGRG